MRVRSIFGVVNVLRNSFTNILKNRVRVIFNGFVNSKGINRINLPPPILTTFRQNKNGRPLSARNLNILLRILRRHFRNIRTHRLLRKTCNNNTIFRNGVLINSDLIMCSAMTLCRVKSACRLVAILSDRTLINRVTMRLNIL